jgi:hypothetical protein
LEAQKDKSINKKRKEMQHDKQKPFFEEIKLGDR